jgi:2-hydroxychromene-2-carboxylate isomerase
MNTRFYFDYISPYAYLAFTQLPAIEQRTGRAIELTPVLFAGLLNAHGNLGPAEIPAKRAYIIRDVLRLAHDFGVPLQTPPAHPFNPLPALRISSVIQDANLRSTIVAAIFGAVWGRGEAIDTPEGIKAALADLPLEIDELIERANTLDAKNTLRQQTERAVAKGIFGVPTILIDEELFWGVDSLRHFEHYLSHGNPFDTEQVHKWENLPSAATRRLSK